MALGYDGKPITGYMGAYIDLVEKYKANDAGVTKATFEQLLKDLEVFRETNSAMGFGKKASVEGESAKLNFPEMTASEVGALLAKLKTTILK